MKRKSFRRLSSKAESKLHHNVYVVLLDAKAGRLKTVLKENPNRDENRPCIYVGMTGLDPAERFKNHKRGLKASSIVKRYGLKLLPEIYSCFNPMPFEAAAIMERELAEDLRAQGYTVTGGH